MTIKQSKSELTQKGYAGTSLSDIENGYRID